MWHGARARFWAWLLVALVLGGVWSSARAQVPTVSYSPGGGAVASVAPTGMDTSFTRLVYGNNVGATGEVLGTDSTFSGLLQRPATLGDVVLQDRAAATRIGSATADLGLLRTIPWSSVLRGAAKALPYLAAADAAYSLYKSYRCYKDSGNLNDLQCDSGTASFGASQGQYKPPANSIDSYDAGIGWQSSQTAACSAYAAAAATYYHDSRTYTCAFTGTGSATQYTVYGNGSAVASAQTGSYQTATVQQCHATVDALDPANSAAEGSPPGPDGLCPTGRYNRTPFDTAAATVQADTTNAATNKAGAVNLVGQLLGAMKLGSILNSGTPVPADGNPFPGVDLTQPGVLRGPSTVAGPATTTTTTPAGGGSATTSTSTPNYALTYSGNSYTYTTSVVVNNSDGSSTTTAGPPTSTAQTDCDKYPDDIGCSKYGSDPSPPSIPTTDAAPSVTPVTFASASGCPSPISLAFSVSGHAFSYTISYQPFCDFCTNAAPIFQALFAAAAAIIFARGMQTL